MRSFTVLDLQGPTGLLGCCMVSGILIEFMCAPLHVLVILLCSASGVLDIDTFI